MVHAPALEPNAISARARRIQRLTRGDAQHWITVRSLLRAHALTRATIVPAAPPAAMPSMRQRRASSACRREHDLDEQPWGGQLRLDAGADRRILRIDPRVPGQVVLPEQPDVIPARSQMLGAVMEQ